jgi:hypothetical protein
MTEAERCYATSQMTATCADDIRNDKRAVQATSLRDPYIVVPAGVTNMWRYRHIKKGPQNRISIDVSGMRRHAGPTVP